ncbi:phage tail protein [Tumebacillus flagellatus]|uniref:Phage tail protein n=1 Tax=Tumebacillus flagellatus TaxID=1157490 RepID=A0A074LRJ1_9BACL|nr:phage tail protein [Tumebacillus flagellatus]KEO84751.1 hypothetical protein EL26_01710 [Tumebacillus flagellatus]
MIGALGDVVFVASADTIRTFEDFKRSSSGRWAAHAVLGKKPVSQFIGPDLDKVTFKIRFDVMYGMNPRAELNRLLEMQRSGVAVPLVIGGKALGVNLWVVTDLDQDWNTIDNKGNLLKANANITLQEYA